MASIDNDIATDVAVASERLGTYRIVIDPKWGYRRLDPLPTAGELDRWYETHYRNLLDKGGRACELARLVAGGPEAQLERAWLNSTLYADVVDALDGGAADGAPRRSLDVGSGTGDVVLALVRAGWEAIGTEPSPALAEMGRERGLRIAGMTAEAYLEDWRAAGEPRFGGITLMNVLEHVADPGGMVEQLIPALEPGGRLVVRVPNDFNPLQAAARSALGGEPWWIAVPDHVNYFDHESIARLIERTGLEVVDRLTDFPMELFLLMGHDYRNDPAVGRELHDRRRRAEVALDGETRRRLGRAWVAAGVGRNSFVVARRPPGRATL